VDPSGRPDIYFVPERGDELSFAVSRSVLSWPTPFDYYIMVRTPRWKRYVYYRLVWKKRSGANLAMLWRYEQGYFAGSGWTKPAMMWNFQTGPLRADIHPQASPENGGPRPLYGSEGFPKIGGTAAAQCATAAAHDERFPTAPVSARPAGFGHVRPRCGC
jgi:hypothetical protein